MFVVIIILVLKLRRCVNLSRTDFIHALKITKKTTDSKTSNMKKHEDPAAIETQSNESHSDLVQISSGATLCD